MHKGTSHRVVPKWVKNAKDCLFCRCACNHGNGGQGQAVTNSVFEMSESPTVIAAQNANWQREDNSAVNVDAASPEEIRTFGNKGRSGEEKTGVSEEWKSIGDQFNRLFFMLFIAIHIIIGLLCFVIIPHIE